MDEDLGEDALALAEVAPVAERLEQPNGLAGELLRTIVVAALHDELGEVVEVASLLERGTGLLESAIASS